MANKSKQSRILFTVPGIVITNNGTNDKESVSNTVKTSIDIPVKSRNYRSKANVKERNNIIVMYSLTENK